MANESNKLCLTEVLYRECGITISSECVISSPFRRDSTPSFRIYLDKETMEYNAFDWGTAEYYNALSLLHKLKGHNNYYETYEYINQNYGIKVGKSEQNYENKLPEAIKLIQKSVPFNKETSPKIEEAILAFLSKNQSKMDQLLASADLVI